MESTEVGSSAPSQTTIVYGVKRKQSKLRADVWNYFTRFKGENDKWKAKCKNCESVLSADPRENDTSTLRKHLDKHYKKKPIEDPTQQQLIVTASEKGKGVMKSIRYDFDAIRKVVAEMIILDELPFKFVNGEGFKRLMALACPTFHAPSHFTMQRDCYEIFCNERTKLKKYFKKTSKRVFLTTDTWTSLQRVNYMCLTAHYIDDNWNICKKLLSFLPITSHRGKVIGGAIEKLLLEWGIENIFTITIDNANSNDVAIAYLKDKLCLKEGSIMGYKFMHVRCVAHILNLVVVDGLNLKHVSISIKRIRDAIRYIKQSPTRLSRFHECMVMEGMVGKAQLHLDVCTRWNSTYSMLDVAVKYQKVFERYEDEYRIFRIDLEEENGVPTASDWANGKRICTFLKHFYDLTMKILGSNYVTSNLFYHEIVALVATLKKWTSSGDEELKTMSNRIKEKYDKYWGNLEKMNKVIYFAAVLDFRVKLGYVEYTIGSLFQDKEVANNMKKQMKDALCNMFDDYKIRLKPTSEEESVSEVGVSSDFSKLSLDGNDDSSLAVMMKIMNEYKYIVVRLKKNTSQS